MESSSANYLLKVKLHFSLWNATIFILKKLKSRPRQMLSKVLCSSCFSPE